MLRYILSLVLLWCNTSFSQVISDDVFVQEVLKEINHYRSSHHLSPLVLDPHASKIAASHSARMVKLKVISHVDFNKRYQLLCKSASSCKGAAENVAYYPMNAKKLVAGWLASPGHRKNISGNYNITGIGLARAKPGWAYYTQIFVKEDKTS